MDMVEKAAYLKGFVEGSDLGFNEKQQKVLDTVLDLLQELAETVDDLDADMDDVVDTVNDIAEELEDMQETIDDISDVVELMSDEMDDIEDDLDLLFDDEDDEDEDENDLLDTLYDVECPNCHEILSVDESILSGGEFVCPSCGEKLEFELTSSEDEEEDEGSDESND